MNPNGKTENGLTALHLAANQGRLDVVKILVDTFKADINICHKQYGTPLHCAAREGKLRVVAFLLISNARIDFLTENELSPMCVSTDDRITTMLIKYKNHIAKKANEKKEHQIEELKGLKVKHQINCSNFFIPPKPPKLMGNLFGIGSLFGNKRKQYLTLDPIKANLIEYEHKSDYPDNPLEVYSLMEIHNLRKLTKKGDLFLFEFCCKRIHVFGSFTEDAVDLWIKYLSCAIVYCLFMHQLDKEIKSPGIDTGDRTFGKGLVQSTRDLPYNGSLKVTISKYYIPSGRCIQAIDYSHRNPDGSVSKVPDSLTTVFHTAAGRPVRDGGGIVPDFKVESPKQPTISYYLVMNNEIFDFVNDWTSKHKQIAPIEEFVFTDEDYDGFKQFMKGRKFSYDRQSEKALKNLKDIAEIEGYMDVASPEFKALEEKLQPNLDRDLDKFKDQIKQLISLEIAKRYYFQKGEMIQSLKIDNELQKALEVLSNQALYDKTLSAPVEMAKPAEASQPTEKK